ncbi:hypothetical protein C8R43DRAFT_1136653 [Mycena crocata]|nr:hypothetical protein C8R43DRAFT_1136653 [Mycena crocata]
MILTRLSVISLVASQAVFALSMPRGASKRDDSDSATIGAPLTISWTLAESSPVQTEGPVATAYAEYADNCGAPLAQALQDALVAYNKLKNSVPPVTNTSDPKFLLFADTTYPDYQQQHKNCITKDQALQNAEAEVFKSTHSATSTDTTSTVTSSGGLATQTAEASATKSSLTATPPPSASPGAAIQHGPHGMTWLVGLCLVYQVLWG